MNIFISLMFISLIFNTIVISRGQILKDNIYFTLLIFEVSVMVVMHDFWDILTKPLAIILLIWILMLDNIHKETIN